MPIRHNDWQYTIPIVTTCQHLCHHYMIGRQHRQQGTTVAPIALCPGKTIPLTQACSCYTAANSGLGATNVDFDDLELLILRCDTCEWIYDPVEELLFNH